VTLFPYTTLFRSSDFVGKEVGFVDEGCVYYFNSKHKFIKLTTMERAYFDFLCETMNGRNIVELNPALRNSFLDFCFIVHKVKAIRHVRTLLKYEEKFFDLNLMFKDSRNPRLTFMNPKYVFKRNSKERRKLIKEITDLINKGHLPYKIFLDMEEEKFTASEELKSLPFPEDFSTMNTDFE
jgi:signal recognition particle subunit SEC65